MEESPEGARGGGWRAIYYPTEQEILVSRGGTTPYPSLTYLAQGMRQLQGTTKTTYKLREKVREGEEGGGRIIRGKEGGDGMTAVPGC